MLKILSKGWKDAMSGEARDFSNSKGVKAAKDVAFVAFLVSLIFILFPWGLLGGTFVGGGMFFEYRGASYLLVLMSLLLFLVSRETFESKKTGLSVFIVMLTIGAFISIERMVNISSTVEFLFFLCTSVGIGFLSLFYSQNRESIELLTRILVLMMGSLAAYGLFQYFVLYPENLKIAQAAGTKLGTDNRVTSVLTSPNLYASLCLLFWPLFIYKIFRAKTNFERLFFVFLAVLLIVSFALTFSRSAFVIAFIQALIATIFFWKREKRISISILSFIGLSAALAAAFLLYKGFGAPAYSSFFSNAITSFLGRLSLWKTALRMIWEQPFTGVGAGAFKSAFMKYQVDGFYSIHAHNTYLEVFAEMGVLGFLTFLAASLYIVMRCCIKNKSSDISKFIGYGVLGLLLHNIFDFSLYINLVTYSMAALLGIGFSQLDAPLIRHRTFPRSAFIAGFVLIFMLTSFMNIGYYMYQIGRTRIFNGDGSGIEYLKLATVFNPVEASYHSELAKAYSLSFRAGTQDKIQRIVETRRASFLEPLNPFYYADLAFFYEEERQNELSIYFLKKAIEAAPLQPAFYYQLGRIQMGSAMFKEAKDTLKKAVSLLSYYEKPYVVQSYRPRGEVSFSDPYFAIVNSFILLGEIAVMEGNYGKAVENYNSALKMSPDNPQAYLGLSIVSLRQKKVKEAEKYALKAVEISPDYSEAWYVFGQVMEAKGEKEKAITSYQRALMLDPANTHAEQALERIKKEGLK